MSSRDSLASHLKPQRVFFYTRASADKKAMLVADQITEANQRVQDEIAAGAISANFCDMGVFNDLDTSRNLNWFERELGYELFRRLEPGDIVVAVYDAAIRNEQDHQVSEDKLHAVGARVIYINEPSSEDRHTHLRSKWTREGIASIHQGGEWCARWLPVGWKMIGRKGNRRYVPDEEERQNALLIVKLRDELKLTVGRLSTDSEYRSQPWFPRWTRGSYKGKCWSNRRLSHAYRAAKEGFPGPLEVQQRKK